MNTKHQIILIGLLLCSFGFTHAVPLKLTVVLSETGGAYQEFSKALSVKLGNRNVSFDVIDTGKPVPDSDLVIAVGMKAAFVVAQAKPVDMLAVLVPKEGFIKLLKDFSVQVNAGNNSYSAIFLDQPANRQLDLIAALLPEARSVGVLYSDPPGDLASLHFQSVARKLKLNEYAVTSAASLHITLQEALVGSDVLLALPDAEIYNASTIRNILLATYRNRVPLIGLSAGYVKAGALGAVFSTPENVAAQVAGIIADYAEKRSLPPAQYAKEFEVLVNMQVAHSLGLNVKSATQLRNEIGTKP